MAIHWYRPFWVLRPQKGPVFKPNDVQVTETTATQTPATETPARKLPPETPATETLAMSLTWGWVPMACQVGCAVICLQYYTHILFFHL